MSVLLSLILLAVPGEAACTKLADCQAACADSDDAACVRLAELQDAAGDVTQASSTMRRACNLGNATACRLLSRRVAAGRGTEPRAEDAAGFLARACALGDAEACLEVSETRPGSMRPEDLFRKLYESCNQGSADACSLVGRMALWGTAGAQELEVGRTLLGRACTMNVPGACLAQKLAGGDDSVSTPPPPGFTPPGKPVGRTGVIVLQLRGALSRGLVAVDGMVVGDGALELAVVEGRHVVQLYDGARRLHHEVVHVHAGAGVVVTVVPPAQLRLAVEPAAAMPTVSVDGKVTPWTAGSALEVSPGQHRLKVEATGYATQEVLVRCDGGQPCASSVRLAAAPVTMRLDSAPSGAAVFQGSQQLGVTPLEVTQPAGKLTLSFRLPGYDAKEADVVFAPNAPPVLVTLTQTQVAVEVRSTPAGAALSIDGAPLGRTPWRGKVLQGEHEFSFARAGYVTQGQRIAVSAEQHVVNVTLAPMPAEFTIDVGQLAVEQLEVRLDGQPVSDEDGRYTATPGLHEVAVSGANVFPSKQRVTLRSDKPARLTFRLKVIPKPPRQGVEVESVPAGGEVSVDGTASCTAPCEVQLNPGPHQVAVALPGYHASPVSVTVKKKQVESVRVVLDALPVAVAIESEPAGASVFLDGLERGVSPLMLQVQPGSHRLYLVKSGFAPFDETRNVAPAANAVSWRVELVSTTPIEPPPPPPPLVVAPRPPEGDALLARLADPQVPEAEKRHILEERAQKENDVTSFVAAVAPRELKRVLCVEYTSRVRLVRLQARLFDAFGDEQQGLLFVNGKKFGKLPFDGMVPWCAETLEGATGEDASRVPPDGAHELSATTTNSVHFRILGRSGRSSFSAFGELAYHPSNAFPLELAADVEQLNWATGVRLDYWGKAFHFSFAVKGSRLFRQGLLGDAAAPLTPLADLYFGVGVASDGDRPRLRGTFDAGMWSLLCPSVRLTFSLSVFERLFITLTGDAHYLIPLLVTSAEKARLTLTDSLSVGGSFAVGFGW